MADTWQEYFEGSPEQRLADLEYQRKQIEAAKQSPKYKEMRRLVMRDTGDYDFDPREGLWSFRTPDGLQVRDQLEPRRTTDFGDDMAYGANYAFAMGQRLRDTALRAEQEFTGGIGDMARGEFSRGAGKLASSAALGMRAPLATAFPSLAAGTPGSPDDWREAARKKGVSEAAIFAFDIGTDPETYLTAPIRGPMALAVPAFPMFAARLAGRASRADDILSALGKAAGAMRYGRGVKTEAVDAAGDVIRRLRNSPIADRIGIPSPPPPRIEYVR